MTKLTHSAELMAQFGADPAVRDSERHKRAFRCVSLHVFYCAFPSARRRARPAAAPPPGLRAQDAQRRRAAVHGRGRRAALRLGLPYRYRFQKGHRAKRRIFPAAPTAATAAASAICASRRLRGGAAGPPASREGGRARPLSAAPGRSHPLAARGGGEAAAASPSRGKRPAPAAPGTPGRGLGGAAAPRGAGAAPGGGRRGRGARAALPPVVTVSRSTSRRPLRSQHGGADGGSARLQWGLLQGTGAVQGRSRAGLCVPRWEQGGAGGRERSLGAGP